MFLFLHFFIGNGERHLPQLTAEPQRNQSFFATRNPPPFDLAGSYADSNVPWHDDFLVIFVETIL